MRSDNQTARAWWVAASLWAIGAGAMFVNGLAQFGFAAIVIAMTFGAIGWNNWNRRRQARG